MIIRCTALICGVATMVVGYGQATGQNWVYSNRAPMAVRGSLNAVANTSGLVRAGDEILGSSLMEFIADSGVTVTFSNFGNPTDGKSAPFDLNLEFEISGIGVVFRGPAAGLNGAWVNIPADGAKNGVAMVLRRSSHAVQNARAGSYVNVGLISISKI